MICAGIGYRRAATAEDIAALVARAGEAAAEPITHLAIPGFKPADDPAALEAAATLGLPIVHIGLDELARAAPACPTRMSHPMPGCGTASAAEAAALAAAGEGAKLILQRIRTPTVTCALAASRDFGDGR
ncbi:MAG: cobalamin biosynthesis protein [Rhodospirillaceae bacterium]|nr:cobalamin biosynthesis protein [Rhodospirillaceae bacterium]